MRHPFGMQQSPVLPDNILVLTWHVCFCLPSQVNDCRALAAIPEHHIMLTGERNGSIKIFQWKPV